MRGESKRETSRGENGKIKRAENRRVKDIKRFKFGVQNKAKILLNYVKNGHKYARGY